MERPKRIVGIAAAVVLGFSTTVVGSASAHHSSTTNPVAGCGQVVAANLTLTHNVGPCPGDGLVVTASGVTVNLAGYSIFGDGAATDDVDGTGDAGVLLQGVSGVTVKGGGTVRSFNAGVVVQGGSGNRIENLTVTQNSALGKDGTYVTDYGDGILILNSSNNVIRANELTENTGYGGIRLQGNSDSNTIGNDGIANADGKDDGNKLENNDEPDSVFAKQTSGIRLEFLPPPVTNPPTPFCDGPNPDNNVIDGNKSELNGNDGIQLFNCANGNVVIKNDFNNNGRQGVHLFPGADGNFIGVTPGGVSGPNVVKANGKSTLGDGINVGGNGNQVKNNVVSFNEDDGISLGFCRQNLPHQPVRCFAGGDNNVIQGNTVTNNGTAGIPPTCPTGDPMCNTIDGEVAVHGNGIHALVGAITNTISGNTVSGSKVSDLRDAHNDCVTNTWTGNTETTKNPACLD